MMGSGKTTVGRALADRLGRPFLDSDEQVEAHTGRTVRQIWEEDGEAVFRRFEKAALAEALAADEPAVIAAAGGTVLDADTRDALKGAGTVVWLSASAAELAARVASGDHRPLLGDDPAGTLEGLGRAREALYDEVADHVVETGDASVEEVVDRVLEAIS
jgi:shikimate kinase